MTPNPLFYQLLLAALVLLCLIIHVWWPDSRRPKSQRPREPAQPRRKRSKEPKPFTGYIHKPLCEACEHGVDTRPKAPGSPPPVITFTRGRKRTVDTQAHFCSKPNCAYQGWLGRGNIRSNDHPSGPDGAPPTGRHGSCGNIRSNGHPSGQSWRQLQCVSCQGYFYETEDIVHFPYALCRHFLDRLFLERDMSFSEVAFV